MTSSVLEKAGLLDDTDPVLKVEAGQAPSTGTRNGCWGVPAASACEVLGKCSAPMGLGFPVTELLTGRLPGFEETCANWSVASTQ